MFWDVSDGTLPGTDSLFYDTYDNDGKIFTPPPQVERPSHTDGEGETGAIGIETGIYNITMHVITIN